MKITIAQLNATVGDIDGNLSKIENTMSQCTQDSPDLVIFPELFLTGYPPRDLLEQTAFIKRVQAGTQQLLKLSMNHPGTGILFGTVTLTGKEVGHGLNNSALLVYEGQTLLSQHKSLLPTYDVFDETRYFDPGPEVFTIQFKDEVLGISICEDAWNDPELWPKSNYPVNPLAILARKGATIFINLSASPFHMGKDTIRFRLLQNHVLKYKVPGVLVNLVGGNDELVFDGRSMVINREGKLIAIFPSWKEHVQTIDTNSDADTIPYIPEDAIASVYNALVLGIRDYMQKCAFTKALLGLSGGIDSALTCCLARDAIGSKNVLGVTMPSLYSSKGSMEDSRKLAKNLGVMLKIIPISPIYSAYIDSLTDHFAGRQSDITEENIQARIRGNILMALSNKLGYLLLSTGNKSELAVGYCTLYGDMSGGLSVISDVPKTMVYDLARFINRNAEIIPKEIIVKPPSAELRPNQTDQDTLPPYEILDQVLHLYLDERCSAEEIVSKDFDSATVTWIIRAINRNEYKRRQAPPGIKVTNKAFGIGRRMPIAAKYDF